MENMTVGQFRELAKTYKYLLIRVDINGRAFGFNTKSCFLGGNKIQPDNKETIFVSWRACNVTEYISYKLPFLKSNT